MEDKSGRPGGLSSLRDEAVPSSPKASIPDADWIFDTSNVWALRHNQLIFAMGRFGDVFGPLPFELFDPEAWRGNMGGAANDLIAYAPCRQEYRDAIPFYQAKAIEAGTAETGTGSVHESAVACDLPKE